MSRDEAGVDTPERNGAALCPGCTEPVSGSDGFCENCGHRLGAGPPAAGVPESADAPDARPTAAVPAPAPGRDHIELPMGAIAGVTDVGLRHARNEDAMAVRTPGPRSPAFAGVVCDGVSSSPRPDDASQTAVDTAAAALTEALGAGVGHREAAGIALTRAAGAVAALAGEEGAPACTYVAASMAEQGGPVTVGWVGDSRAYWLPAPGTDAPPRLLTRDDSWSAAMVDAGVLSAQEAEASAYAHAITAWLGADSGEIDGHIVTVAPPGAGTVVLCTDGLWNYAPEPEDIAAVLAGAYDDPIGAARAGVQFARDSGGRDNITVVVLRVPEASAETGPQESAAAGELPAEPSVPTVANRPVAPREHAREQQAQQQAQYPRQEEET